eukprot:4557921-Amphidinium_carterae.1
MALPPARCSRQANNRPNPSQPRTSLEVQECCRERATFILSEVRVEGPPSPLVIVRQQMALVHPPVVLSES